MQFINNCAVWKFLNCATQFRSANWQIARNMHLGLQPNLSNNSTNAFRRLSESVHHVTSESGLTVVREEQPRHTRQYVHVHAYTDKVAARLGNRGRCHAYYPRICAVVYISRISLDDQTIDSPIWETVFCRHWSAQVFKLLDWYRVLLNYQVQIA